MKESLFMKKKTGYFLTGFGILVALLSLTIDLFGIGKAGIQSAQLLGIQIGVIVALFGVGLVNTTFKIEKPLWDRMAKAFQKFLNLPISVWMLSGFLLI